MIDRPYDIDVKEMILNGTVFDYKNKTYDIVPNVSQSCEDCAFFDGRRPCPQEASNICSPAVGRDSQFTTKKYKFVKR